MTTATAQASPNIAFIKYWGNRDNALRLPMNGSISMNLDGLFTRTTVSFQPSLPFDELIINGHEVTGPGLDRVSYILDIIRGMANIQDRAEVMTENNFPSGAGIASSASAFAALALAGSKAAGLDLSEQELSRLARRGSGSASRSIPADSWNGRPGQATKIHSPFRLQIRIIGNWWIALPLSAPPTKRPAPRRDIPSRRPVRCRLRAWRMHRADWRSAAARSSNCDFDAFASIVELDSDMMHSVMMTSTPALHYWKPASLEVMNHVRAWRAEGIPPATRWMQDPMSMSSARKQKRTSLTNDCVKSRAWRMCWLPAQAAGRKL